MIKIKNILFLLSIALTAIFFVFHDEIGGWLKLLMQQNNFYSSIETPSLVSGLFVGDVMLSRGVAYQIEKNSNLYYPFEQIKDFLSKNDFVFANLESPIIDGRKIKAGEMIFRADEKLAPILKEMNFSVFSLANNHILNFGEKGLMNTFKILNENKIIFVGAGENFETAHQFKIIERNGIRFAFLAYAEKYFAPEAKENEPGVALMDLEQLKNDVEKARQKADFVIVSMHAGEEYKDYPSSAQINFAHYAIDAGADLVIGHHPHVIESIEKYKNGYIFYSLGNFIFDQMWSNETREAIALRIIFTPNAIKIIQIYPILIENYSQPKIINSKNNPSEFKRIVSKLNLADNKFVIIDQ